MRKIAVLASAMLAVATLGIGAAGATPPPPITGTINCSMAGTLTLNHPLSNTAGTKAIKIKGTATGSSCDTTGTSGGKFTPVSGVSVKISGSLPVGATCVSLAAPVFGKTKIQVKFLGLNPKGKTATNAVDNTFLASASVTSVSPINIALVTQPITKGAFVGQTLTLNVGIDLDSATLLTQCGGTGITSLAFGSVTPSNVTSP